MHSGASHPFPSFPLPQPEILNLVGRMAKAGFPDHDPSAFAPDPQGGPDRLDCALAASSLYYLYAGGPEGVVAGGVVACGG